MERRGEKIENLISGINAPRHRVAASLRRALIIFLILFLIWVFIAPSLAKNLIVEKTLERADAILVLGGSATYLERTDKAAELFRKGASAKIFLTDDGTRGGWSRVEQRNIPFIELAQRNLIARGVSAENIEIIKPQNSGTIYEARAFAETAKRENLKTILLVTSAYHTRRALRTFEREFAAENLPTEIGIESAPNGWETPSPSVWWLSISGWQAVAGEYVKSVYYWMFY
ncbi:MAG: YdcF family protein [Pyrinomonadaceae bacterium]